MKPKVEDYGLMKAVYNEATVKLPVNNLNHAKLPGICPHCLEPGDITETFSITLERDLGYQKQIQTIGVPISTHARCSRGFTKKNISGSIKVWGEGQAGGGGRGQGLMGLLENLTGAGGRVCFSFKDPWYALLFTRINYPLLLNGRGQHLLILFDSQFSGYSSRHKQRFSKRCPRCNYGIDTTIDTCPSCDLDLTTAYVRYQSVDIAAVDVQDNIDNIVGVASKCPDCGIIMMKDKQVKNCARCGAKLE